jgi:hypothetical protein
MLGKVWNLGISGAKTALLGKGSDVTPQNPPSPSSLVSRTTAAAGVSSKVSAAALGSAVATIFWVIAAATWWKNTFSDSTLAVLTGASATILAYVLGYLKADPLRQDGGA